MLRFQAAPQPGTVESSDLVLGRRIRPRACGRRSSRRGPLERLAFEQTGPDACAAASVARGWAASFGGVGIRVLRRRDGCENRWNAGIDIRVGLLGVGVERRGGLWARVRVARLAAFPWGRFRPLGRVSWLWSLRTVIGNAGLSPRTASPCRSTSGRCAGFSAGPSGLFGGRAGFGFVFSGGRPAVEVGGSQMALDGSG